MDDLKTYQFAAVLTGDIISSRQSSVETLDAALQAIAQGAEDFGRDCHGFALFTRYRGDGWQVFLPEGEMALRAALRLIAVLRAADTGLVTRIGIGLGTAHLPATCDLGAAHGEAFTLAGDVLDGMHRNDRLQLPGLPDAADPAYSAMVMLLDWQARHWTAAQAEALFEALRIIEPTQDEIAEAAGVTRQAIQLRLAATGLRAIRQSLWAYESRIRDLWTQRERAE